MRILRLSERLAIVAVAIGLGACANIVYERDESIPIPTGATVAFGGGKSEGSQNLDPAVSNDTVHDRIQKSIAAQLESRGFRMVSNAASADFLVRYFVAVRPEPLPTPAASGPGSNPAMGPGWGWGWGGGSIRTITPVDFAEVTFVVELVQRTTGRTAWRAVWRGNPGTRAPSQQQIDENMTKIFSSAPVA